MDHTTGYVLQQVVNVVQLASFYLPLALAFAIVQAITRRIFLAFGSLAMFASFAAIYTCYAGLLRGDSDLLSALWSLAAAVACGAALGVVTARVFLGKDLLQSPLAFMIASIGLAIAVQEVMRIKSMGRDVWVPPLFQGQYVFVLEGGFDVRLPAMTALAITAASVAVVGVVLLLGHTRLGLQWRAASQSLRLTALCGVDSLRIAALSFGLAGALAGVTGWTAAISYGGANASIGLMVGFKAMFASVIGGFGSLRGAAAGAITLAILEVAWSSMFSTSYRDVAVFAFIIAALVLRPEGILSTLQSRESEESL
jgi:branched-chain amino acid transport system permease protein